MTQYGSYQDRDRAAVLVADLASLRSLDEASDEHLVRLSDQFSGSMPLALRRRHRAKPEPHVAGLRRLHMLARKWLAPLRGETWHGAPGRTLIVDERNHTFRSEPPEHELSGRIATVGEDGRLVWRPRRKDLFEVALLPLLSGPGRFVRCAYEAPNAPKELSDLVTEVEKLVSLLGRRDTNPDRKTLLSFVARYLAGDARLYCRRVIWQPPARGSASRRFCEECQPLQNKRRQTKNTEAHSRKRKEEWRRADEVKRAIRKTWESLLEDRQGPDDQKRILARKYSISVTKAARMITRFEKASERGLESMPKPTRPRW